MTTSVKILIEGNKACLVKVIPDGDGPTPPSIEVRPGCFTTVYIHGQQRVSIIEIGEFLS